MLSLTYVLTALKIEQDRVRGYLDALSRNLEDNLSGIDGCDQNVLEQLLYQIKRVHLNCSWRRLEVHVLPEIRGSSESMDTLLAELDSFRLIGLDLYRTIRDRLRMAIKGDQIHMQDLMRVMNMYCSIVKALLAKEEHHLFIVAFSSIEEEKWFVIAQRFMQIEKETLECEEMGAVAHGPHGQEKDLHHRTSDISISGVELPVVQQPQSELCVPAVVQDGERRQPFPRLVFQQGMTSAQGA